MPKSCKSDTINGPSASMDLPASAKRYEKVCVGIQMKNMHHQTHPTHTDGTQNPIVSIAIVTM